MGDEEVLEEKIVPITNPSGPNKQDTEELIKALSTVIESSYAFEDVKENTKMIIKQIVAGYELQSGEKYDGHLPEVMRDGNKESEHPETRA